MTGEELKAWAAAQGLSAAGVGDRAGLSRETVSRYMNGARPIPDKLAEMLLTLPLLPAKAGKPAAEGRIALARAEIAVAGVGRVAAAPVVVDPNAGLRPFPRSNLQWAASVGFDSRQVVSPWKRVPGCARVVHESIPEPIPFYAPAWAGWRGVPTADGRVFDFETGHEMRAAARREREGAAMGSRLKGGKVKR